jgi:hypothetical protein
MCEPNLTLPTLPSLGGLSISPPTLPSFSGNLSLCCKEVPWATPTFPPVMPPLIFNAGVAVALGAALDTVQAYLDEIPRPCSLE